MLDPKGIDLVIPLGSGSRFRNAELRYCLRSIQRHAKGVRRVVIIGNKPEFLSKEVTHFYSPFFEANKEARIMQKVLWAFENTDISDTILFVNDDYVFMQDFDARQVKPYQRGPLLESIPKNPEEITAYKKAIEATHKALADAKLPTYHYDIHVPILFRRDKFVALRPWWERSARHKHGLTGKSIYGNNLLKAVPGPRMTDCKLKGFTTEADFRKRVEGRWVFSYGDQALYDGFENALYKLFPEVSRFETSR